MSCVLRAVGEDFDADGFLTGSPFKAVRVWHKGEQRRRKRAGSPTVHPDSGFVVDVSNESGDALASQVGDAVVFLESHTDEIERLARFPGFDSAWLDFALWWRDVGAQFDRFPPKLVSLAGRLGLGLELSHYGVASSLEERGNAPSG